MKSGPRELCKRVEQHKSVGVAWARTRASRSTSSSSTSSSEHEQQQHKQEHEEQHNNKNKGHRFVEQGAFVMTLHVLK